MGIFIRSFERGNQNRNGMAKKGGSDQFPVTSSAGKFEIRGSSFVLME